MFKKVAFIGAGSMAEAIISGMIQTSFLQREQIFVTNKNNQERLDRLSERYKIQCSQDKADVLTDADVIVLSMKTYDVKVAIQDRKSTRLNSSHVAISYAVFCLKKKIY